MKISEETRLDLIKNLKKRKRIEFHKNRDGARSLAHVSKNIEWFNLDEIKPKTGSNILLKLVEGILPHYCYKLDDHEFSLLDNAFIEVHELYFEAIYKPFFDDYDCLIDEEYEQYFESSFFIQTGFEDNQYGQVLSKDYSKAGAFDVSVEEHLDKNNKWGTTMNIVPQKTLIIPAKGYFCYKSNTELVKKIWIKSVKN